MADRIFITALAVQAYHGVLHHEAQLGQPFFLDIDMAVNLKAAGKSDDLADTVSYADVASVATKAFTDQRFQLIEAAGEAVASAILNGFPKVLSVTVTVHKPQAPIGALARDIGIAIFRCRT